MWGVDAEKGSHTDESGKTSRCFRRQFVFLQPPRHVFRTRPCSDCVGIRETVQILRRHAVDYLCEVPLLNVSCSSFRSVHILTSEDNLYSAVMPAAVKLPIGQSVSQRSELTIIKASSQERRKS